MIDFIWNSTPSPADVETVKALTRATSVFSIEEIEMSGDMIADTLSGRFVYDFLFARDANGVLAGYSCFGRIELTKSAYDLYWIATHPDYQGKGLAKQILARTQNLIKAAGGDQIYVETSSLPAYEAARSFYVKHEFMETTRFKNFYKPGDDKVVYRKDV
jgi:ribosomal protein S18 acetylase RimI-like enzyme